MKYVKNEFSNIINNYFIFFELYVFIIYLCAVNQAFLAASMKKFYFILIALLSLQNAFSTDFYFLGTEDTDFNNPDNWSPAYPGVEIQSGDVVFVQSNLRFKGFDVVVRGKLDISLGSSMTSSDSGIKIEQDGKLINNGEIKVNKIENAGKCFNSANAYLTTISCKNETGGEISNMLGAIFLADELLNEAELNNYSLFQINDKLTNKAKVNVFRHAKLIVLGTLDFYEESAIRTGVNASTEIQQFVLLQSSYTNWLGIE